MKKTVCFIIIIIILFSSQTACTKKDIGASINDPLINDPNNVTLRFDSYEDLYESLRSKKNDDNNTGDYSSCFLNLLNDFCDGNVPLYCPIYNGEVVQLKNTNGNTILLRSSEKFNCPWMLFYSSINGNDVVFEICYLNSMENPDISEESTYSDISLLLAPLYPVAHTFSEENLNAYKSITEQDILFCNGTSTVATVYDYNDTNYWHRINYRFRYNDIIVSVWNSSSESYDFLNEDFIKCLSFSEITIETNK